MKINKRLRVVISTILISILMTIISPLGQCVCYANDSLGVSFSNPKWSYDIFSYGTVTVTGASGSNKIKTISIHTDNGYIVGGQIPSNKTSVNDLTDEERTSMLPTLPSGGKWTTELPEEKDGYVTYQTAVCTLGSVGYSGEETADFIKQIKFMLKDYSTNIDVTIDLDASDNSLPEGSNVTRGTNDGTVDLSDHYYMFVPEIVNWDVAYKKAKKLEFMGMKGYLVTVTSLEEDLILDNITMDGAWAGASIVKKTSDKQTAVESSAADYDLSNEGSWLSWQEVPSEQGDHIYDGEYVWEWVCGPEAGKMIRVDKSWSQKTGLKSPDVDYSSEKYCEYRNWNRNLYEQDSDTEETPFDSDKRPFEGDEPNNHWNEYCMMVHYESNKKTTASGEQVASSRGQSGNQKGWNDLPNTTGGYVQGYFVEFSGLDITQETHATGQDLNREYAHSAGGWKYDHVASGEMTAEQRVVITCTDPSHLECLYKPKKADGTTDNPLYREVVLTITAAGKDYDDGPVDAATVTFTEKINEVETSIPESDYSKFGFDSIGAVNYISTDQQGYSSTTPPTDAGEYKAVTGLYKSGQADPIISVEKAFTISKVPLKITLNDQVVYVGDDIKRNIDVIDTDKHKCLISSIDGLKSPDGTDDIRDKLDSIASTAIKPSTTDVKGYAVGYEKAKDEAGAITIENPATNIVIKSADGTRDVTDNYTITVVNGGIKVTKHPTKTLDYPDDPKAAEITYGQTLSESTITGECHEEGTTTDVDGEFVWKNTDGKSPDQIYPEVTDSENTEYNAAFNPEDPGTYESIDFKQKVKVNPKSIPDNLGEKIDPKTGKDIGINSKISVDIANNAVVELYDKQTGKDLVKGTDYTISETINSGTKKVEITITGQGNYKDTTSTFYVDAHEFKSVFETEVVVESSAQELKPGASKIDVPSGKKYLKYQVNKLGTTADEESAKIIAKEVEASSEDKSSNGSYQALATVTISNADYISATAETDTDEKAQKECAEEAIGATGATVAGKKTVPAGATIGMYFDVDMDLEYLMYEPSETTPFIERKRSATNPDEGPIKIHDTSKTAVADDHSISDFAGIEEEVQIVVPDRKGIDDKPLYAAKGYSRTYYIIRTHDEDGVAPYNYDWEVLDVTRGKTDDGLIKLTFKTDKFSKYALAYTETKDPEKKKDIPTSDEPSSSSSSSSNSTFTAANVKQAAPTTVQIVAPKTADTADMPAAVILVIAGIVLIFYVITMDSDERKNDEQSTQIKVRLSEKLNREILKVKLKLLVESIENYIKDIKNKINPGAR